MPCRLSPAAPWSRQTGPPSSARRTLFNVVALKEFYKQEGFKELEYPSLGTLSLQDPDEDLYSSPMTADRGRLHCRTTQSLRTKVKINPEDFFHPQFNYDFTNIRDGDVEFMRGNERTSDPAAGTASPCGSLRSTTTGTPGSARGRTPGPSRTTDTTWTAPSHHLDRRGNPPRTPSSWMQPPPLDSHRALKGRGVYSTPDINWQRRYCKRFQCPKWTGRRTNWSSRTASTRGKGEKWSERRHLVGLRPRMQQRRPERAIVQESIRAVRAAAEEGGERTNKPPSGLSGG
ncbi:uncharacterized protein LOC117827513 [Notolabrus celidotus]|uniref:uncharacterized protein LOC117827513 n=1 Tax=Notolabrus celidotus TaxID=1203425 RepID=UPI00148FA720|nr:uncharacterized protein LOC117827513 [Notolabrus celidotus]